MNAVRSDQSGTIIDKKCSLFASTVEFMTDFFLYLRTKSKRNIVKSSVLFFPIHSNTFRAHFWTSGIKNMQKILVQVKEHLCSVKMWN